MLKKWFLTIPLLLIAAEATAPQYLEDVISNGNIYVLRSNEQQERLPNTDRLFYGSEPEGGRATEGSEVGYTQGQLGVSLTGAATYTIPIAVPPGINGVQPDLAIVYNSQGGNGLAGWGWNIGGISVITRVPATKHHDDRVGNIVYEMGGNGDRFALDGQRLLPPGLTGSGSYGEDGFVYQLENHSNIKVTSRGETPYGPNNFLVEYPDGSHAVYGWFNNSRTKNDYAITYWQNPQGLRVSYEYALNGGNLRITKIAYGSKGTQTPINEIKFLYITRSRTEQAFVGGHNFERKHLLKTIQVRNNGFGYRTYNLQHNTTSLGYDRLSSVQEFSGDGTKSYTPILFDYTDTNNEGLFELNTTGINQSWQKNGRNSTTVAGDFSGDGNMEVVLYHNDQKDRFWLYKNIQTSSYLSPSPTVINGGNFQKLFLGSLMTQNGRLKNKQGLVAIQKDGYNARFKTYELSTSGAVLQYQRLWDGTHNQYHTCHPRSCEPMPKDESIEMIYHSGDFNGDGIIDLIALEKNYKKGPRCIPDSSGHCTDTPTITISNKVHFINLDRRVETNFANRAGFLQDPGQYGKVVVADVTGNGKSNLIHFIRDSNGNNHKVKIYELDDDNRLQHLYTYTDTGLDYTDKQIMIGDFNGDGKMDFVLPQAYGQTNWNFYFSKGNGQFHKENTNLGLYYYDNRCLYGYYTAGCQHNNHMVIEEWQYIAGDYDGDGKSDIIVQKSLSTTDLSCNPDDFGYGGHTMFTDISFYRNKNVRPGNITFETNTSETIRIEETSRSPVPLFLSHHTPIYNREFALFSNSKIHTFGTGKDNQEDILIRKVTDGYGLSKMITYKSLIDEPDVSNGLFQFYATSTQEQYPNFESGTMPSYKVVSKLEQEGGGISKQQLFGYFGPVSNMEGLGFLGFRGLVRTNWYNNDYPVKMHVSKHDPNLRGAVTESYTILGTVVDWGVYTPTTFIDKTENTYESQLLPNKVFKLKNTTTTRYNGLNNTGIYTVREFDAHNSPTKETVQIKEGNSIKQTTVTNITYDDNPSGSLSSYYIGRPKTRAVSTTAYGNTLTGKEWYSYNGNQTLNRLTKKGHNTATIYEDNTYDEYGNITKKTILAPEKSQAGDLLPDIPRITRSTTYEYDNSGRFLIKSTDPEGLETTYTYHSNNGWLLSETNPFGHTTQYEYDSWGKQTKVTDYLGNYTNITYTRTRSGYTVMQTSNDGSASLENYDKLERKTKIGIMNLESNWVNTQYQYDIYGRKIKVSEPYIGVAIPQWNETEYDDYGRPNKIIEATGKVTNLTYNGLATTVNDGYKSVTTRKDAMGNVARVTDPGGIINYTYFANGNMKTANYGGSIQYIEQDGWGRKTKLTDPSAGIYEYTYNGFGEPLTETTPKGTTTYERNDEGRILNKTVVGDHTDMETTYIYHGTYKQLTDMIVVDAIEGTGATYQYTYDNHRRPEWYTEKLPDNIKFRRKLSYNSMGNVSTERLLAEKMNSGISSDITVSYSYKNGELWKVSNNDGLNIKSIWETATINARGQLLTGTFGNNITVSNGFTDYGFPTAISHTYNGPSVRGTAPNGNILWLNYNFDNQQGILNNRNRDGLGYTETFTHDNQNRLTHATNPAGNQSQSYDNRGRIDQNSQVGTYSYNSSGYQATAVALNTNGINHYNTEPLQEITYNAFKQPVSIHAQTGNGTIMTIKDIDFAYNTFGERSIQYSGGFEQPKEDRPYRKYYSSIAPMEIVHDRTNGTFTFTTYLGGDAYSAPVVYKGDGTDFELLYLHRDYLGSILAITNEDAEILEERHFGPWGSIDWIKDGNGNTIDHLTVLDRGYTGHEHLEDVGLIHMNGRLYDPVLHRFLAPDNYVQDPFNTQNFNRYGYVLNNPLSYMDPSGEFFWIAVGIGAFIGGASQAIQGKNFGQILGGTIIGGLAGMVGAGVGNVVAGGTFFGSSVVTTIGFSSGLASGFAGGFTGGFIGGAGTAWLNGSGFHSGLRAGISGGAIGGAAGGLINGISSGVRYKKALAAFRKGNAQLGISGSDPVPMKDSFIKQAQEAWYSEAPTESLINHSIENAPESVLAKMNANEAAAATVPTKNSVTGMLTGRSSIYYNTNGAAFVSARQLFFTMGHELVHVSQFAALAGQPASILTSRFYDLMEFHAYSYEWSLGSGNAGGFNGQMSRGLSLEFPNYFKNLSYHNYPWTKTASYFYPF